MQKLTELIREDMKPALGVTGARELSHLPWQVRRNIRKVRL